MTKLRKHLRLVLMLLLGFVVAAAGLVLFSLSGSPKASAVSSTCTQSGTTATVTLGDGTTTLSEGTGLSTGLLELNGAACSGAATGLTSILVQDAATTPTGVVLVIDETAGQSGTYSYDTPTSAPPTNWFGCSVVVANAGSPANGDTAGTSGMLEVKGGAGTDLTAGGSGIDIGTGTPPSTAPTAAPTACGSANVTVSGYTSLTLLGGGTFSYTPPKGNLTTQAPSLSAAGETGDAGSSSAAVPVTLDGSLYTSGSPDSFVGGQQPDTFLTRLPSSEIDYSQADTGCGTSTCSLTVNLTTAAVGTVGADAGTFVDGVTASATYPITLTGTGVGGASVPADFTTFRGLTAGPSDFDAAPSATVNYELEGNATLEGATGSYAVTSSGTSNQVQAGAGTEAFTVSGSSTSFYGGTDSDTFTVDGTANTFVPGTPSQTGETETFYDDQPGNILNFQQVGTSSSAPLTINASGNPQAIPNVGQTVTVPSGQAAVGETSYYTFRDGAANASSSDFSTFDSSSSGNTAFLASGTGGLNFSGTGTGNSVYFDGTSTGVVANLSGTQQTATGAISSTQTLSLPFAVPSGQVLVANPDGATQCTVSPSPCDVITGATTLTDPTNTGYSTFYAGPSTAATSYTFTAAGDDNRFVGNSATDLFTGSGNGNDFVAGAGQGTFTETTSAQGASANNTVDFSNVPVGSATGCTAAPCSLRVNVSGSGASGTNYQAVLRGVANQVVQTYSFGGDSDGAAFTNLIGASGGQTTFEGGLGNYTYTGEGTGNTLDFSQSAGSGSGTQSLSFDVATTQTQTNPLVTFDQQAETFSGITNLIGLSSGATSFVGGNTGGYTFEGQGSGTGTSANTADFSAQGPSTTLAATVTSTASTASGSAPATAVQAVVGGSITFEQANGTVVCSAVPVTSLGSSTGATCNTSNPSAGTQFLSVYTPPKGSPSNGSADVVTPVAAGTASVTQVSGVTVNGGGSLYQNEPATLTATLGPTDPTGGTMVFSIAGGPTLCTITGYAGQSCPIQAGGTLPSGVTDSVTAFPDAGAVDIVAQYLPPGSSSALASASVTAVTATALSQTTTTVATITPSVSCRSDFYEEYSQNYTSYLGYEGPASVCIATATVPTDAGALPAGNVSFTVLDEPGQSTPTAESCGNFVGIEFGYEQTSTSNAVGGSTDQVSCAFNVYSSSVTVEATYQPTAAATMSVSPSVGVTTFSDPQSSEYNVGASTPTTTTLTTSTSSVAPGAPVFLQATVADGAGTRINGGTVTFQTGDGQPLSTVSVPTGATSATVQYAGSLPRSGAVDVLAYYTPQSGSPLGGSASVLSGTAAISVAVPATTTTTKQAPAVTTANGVALNLSTASWTNSAKTLVLGPGEAEVATPSGSSASCTAGTTSTFCDTLSDITSVLGSTKGGNTFVAGSTSQTFGDSGTAGADTLDFSNVTATSSSLLTVNTTGGNVGAVAPDTATLGATATYTFTNPTSTVGGADFTRFVGSGGGYTNFLTGTSFGYTFNGLGSGDAIDFSAATVGLNVNLGVPSTSTCGAATGANIDPTAANTVPGTVSFNPGVNPAGGTTYNTQTDTITGLTSITGAAGGGNTFCGDAGSDTLMATGSGNYFYGGTGNDTFAASGGTGDHFVAGSGSYTIMTAQGGTVTTADVLDFSGVTGGPLTVNASNGQIGATAATTATDNGATYNFSTLAGVTKTYLGSPQGTHFFPGTVSDSFDGSSSATTNELDYSKATSSPLTISTATGAAVLGNVNQSFQNIQTFDGLASGQTTFSASSGPFTFNGAGTGNTADFTNALSGITADLTATPAAVTIGSATDHLTGITNIVGSSKGANTFKASGSSESFNDPGTVGGDTVDFSGVPTSQAAVLAVNVSGAPATSGAVSVPDQTAATPAYQYSFTSPSGHDDFTTLVGSSDGNTNFYGGPAVPTGGYSLTGQGGNDNLYLTTDAKSASVNLATGQLNPNTSGTATDKISDLTGVYASSGGDTITGDANDDTFDVTGSNEDFIVGSGGAVITDPGMGNVVDLSNQGAYLSVNSSGSQVEQVPADTASGAATTSFSNVPTTFKGATAGTTTFYASTLGDTFIGQGPTNTLSFAGSASNGPLAFCTVQPAANLTAVAGSNCGSSGPVSPATGQAVLGGVKEPFADIQTFDSLPSGNTSFVLGVKDVAETLNATGTGNSADFSGDTSAISADLADNTVCPTGATTACGTNADTISGVSTVYGSTTGGNLYTAGYSSETFGNRSPTTPATPDEVDLRNVTTNANSPLTVNVSGTSTSGAANDTAATSTATYSFTVGGADVTRFLGSLNGFTRFDAPRSTLGYAFCPYDGAAADVYQATCGAASGVSTDILDLSANTSGLTADLVDNTVSYGTAPTDLIGAPFTSGTAQANGLAQVIGSNSGADTFYGGGSGVAFSDSSGTNLLSYAKLTSQSATFDLSRDTVTPGSGTADSFSFPGSTPTLQGTAKGGDTFNLGTTAANIEGDGGAGDTLSLANTPAPGSGTAGDTVDLPDGTVTGATIGTVGFTYGCPGSAPTFCPTTITGSKYADDIIAPATLGAATTVNGGGGADALDLSQVSAPATITMPITGVNGGYGTGNGGATLSGKTLTFAAIPDVTGTSGGGDTFVVGSGNEALTEPGVSGTLDLRAIGATKATAGAQISVGESTGTSSGTVSSTGLGINDTFTNLGNTDAGNSAAAIFGTPGVDTFTQTSNGSFNFLGQGGNNILNLSGLSASVNVTLKAGGSLNLDPPENCAAGTNDGTATDAAGDVADNFECMSQVITAGTQIFTASPGQTTELDGGGNGTLMLGSYSTTGAGLTITLPNGSAKGTVTDGVHTFSFTGMSTVDGSPYDDTFIPGSGNVTINGGGGDDAVTYRSAAAAADVNLSPTASFTIPTGSTGAGTTVAPGTATGGNGGTLTLQGISNVIGTSKYNDTIVGGPNPGTLLGGSGSTRFVPTGGDDYIDGGTGTGTTVDLSLLTGQTSLNLAIPTPQQTGDGVLTVVPGTIHTAIASPGGSTLTAGNGNVTLDGGTGNDTLVAGTGTQTLNGGGGTDTLIGGSGTQTLTGGSSPVTFEPGSGNETLTSTTTGNTLSYANAPLAAQVNLSTNLYTVPVGRPFANTVLAADTATGGHLGSMVKLTNAGITNVTGSAQADIIVSSTSSSTLAGDGGGDLIVLAGGNNTVYCGTAATTACTAGATFLVDGAGSNIINGGGTSTIDFSQATAGVSVNLQTGIATGGFGGTQSLTGVLNAVGTNYNDSLIANAAGGTVTGLNATSGDFLEAGPSGHTTLVSGGDGNDTFCAESSCAVAGTTAGGGDTMTGGGGTNLFLAQNGTADTLNAGTGQNEAYEDPGTDILLPSAADFEIL